MSSTDFELIARGIVQPMREFVVRLFEGSSKRIEDLERRIGELESHPQMRYVGLYQAERIYRAGETVTHDGHMWHCNKTDPGPIPGVGWTLCVMRGRPGKAGRQQ
jgi:hypothetical protein